MRATSTTKTTTVQPTSQPTDEDQQRIEKILQDPELAHTLQSPRIQQLLLHLRTDPVKAQRFVRMVRIG